MPPSPLPQLPLEVVVPAWAAPLNRTNGLREASFKYNRQLVASTNAEGSPLDMVSEGMGDWRAHPPNCVCAGGRQALLWSLQVFYGDSIAGLPVFQPENWAVWQEFFGAAAGWKAAALGVGGSTVEELTVRRGSWLLASSFLRGSPAWGRSVGAAPSSPAARGPLPASSPAHLPLRCYSGALSLAASV